MKSFPKQTLIVIVKRLRTGHKKHSAIMCAERKRVNMHLYSQHDLNSHQQILILGFKIY